MATETERNVLRMGIVGSGLGTALMLPAIATDGRFSIAGLASRRQSVREDFVNTWPGAMAFDSVEALCDSATVDAVYIATPASLHKEQVLAALERGKHVIVEKPLAVTLEDCDAIIEALSRAQTHLVCGETHAFIPTYRKMREIIAGGELGSLGMILSLFYTDFVYRPRRPEELDPATGGGSVFNQGSHQVDIVRLLGGGMVRSVRAYTGVWDRGRIMEGSYMAFLDFEAGAAASMVFSGYDHFDSDEFHFWVGESGITKPGDRHGKARQAFGEIKGPEDEISRRDAISYKAFLNQDRSSLHMPHHGVVIASLEHADLRPSADGLLIYGDNGAQEIPISPAAGIPGRTDTLDELYNAVARGVPPLHDARWSKATLEVLLASYQSQRERREIMLHHQIPASATS